MAKMGVFAEDKAQTAACSMDVHLEAGKIRVDERKAEKDCRICHLGLESGGDKTDVAIELGCSCKEDLAAAHKQCAETWFKIRGNKTCEICGSTATNVVDNNEVEAVEEQLNETSNPADPAVTPERGSFWRGHRFVNFLLSCMVFAFVISWLFHFNVPS